MTEGEKMKLKELTENIESTCLEYKVSLEAEKPRSWLKSVSAFANTAGGCIVFGVTDKDHQVVGLNDAQTVGSRIAELISARIQPHADYEMTVMESGIPGRPCLALEIYCGRHTPYYYVHEQTKECFVRRGDRSELATPLELNNLILKGMHETYDALPSGYALSDVSFTLLGATFKKETGDDFNPAKDLRSMKLVDEKGIVTYAGLLLCDQGYLRQSKIVCTRWKGTEKGAIDGDALDDEEFSGASLIMLLTSAEAFIRSNSRKPWTIRGMRREEQSDYPFRAVREVLVNALIHRDYQYAGAEVHVDMYDDRMEITSPGGMMSGSRIQDLNLHHVPSMRRNEIISDIFGRLHYMDRRGSGLSRVLNAYAGLQEQPAFYSDASFFQVVLPNRSAAERVGMNAPDASGSETYHEKVYSSLENVQLSGGKVYSSSENVQFSPEAIQLPGEKVQLSEEEQRRADLQRWMVSLAGTQFKSRTFARLIQFYLKYGHEYSFNRENVMTQMNIKPAAASRLLQKCTACGIMRKERNGVYYFNKTK